MEARIFFRMGTLESSSCFSRFLFQQNHACSKINNSNNHFRPIGDFKIKHFAYERDFHVQLSENSHIKQISFQLISQKL